MSTKTQYNLAFRLIRLNCYSLYQITHEYRLCPVIVTRAWESLYHG